jgi:hypothetical protein
MSDSELLEIAQVVDAIVADVAGGSGPGRLQVDRRSMDRLSEAGLWRVAVAEEVGGSGGEPGHLAVVLRRLGWGAAALPFLEDHLAAELLGAHSSALPDGLLTVASRSDLVARGDSGRWVVSGQCAKVPGRASDRRRCRRRRAQRRWGAARRSHLQDSWPDRRLCRRRGRVNTAFTRSALPIIGDAWSRRTSPGDDHHPRHPANTVRPRARPSTSCPALRSRHVRRHHRSRGRVRHGDRGCRRRWPFACPSWVPCDPNRSGSNGQPRCPPLASAPRRDGGHPGAFAASLHDEALRLAAGRCE